MRLINEIPVRVDDPWSKEYKQTLKVCKHIHIPIVKEDNTGHKYTQLVPIYCDNCLKVYYIKIKIN